MDLDILRLAKPAESLVKVQYGSVGEVGHAGDGLECVESTKGAFLGDKQHENGFDRVYSQPVRGLYPDRKIKRAFIIVRGVLVVEREMGRVKTLCMMASI